MAGAPAWGFVRKKTDGGLAEYWQPNCIQLDVYINDFAGMSRDEIAKSISAAAHTWSPTAVTCPDGSSHPFFEIVPSLAPANARAPRPGYDGHNTLQFYTAGSPYPENSALGGSTIALTSVWARADGHIVDADVQVNALDNTFANLDPGYVSADGTLPVRSAERRHPRVRAPAGPRPLVLGSVQRLRPAGRRHGCGRPDVLPAARRRQGHGDVRDHRQRRRNDQAQPVARRHPGCLRDLSGQRRSARVRAGHARRRLRLPHGRAPLRAWGWRCCRCSRS